MAKINLKSIFTSENSYTVLQTLKELINKDEEIDYEIENAILSYIHYWKER